MMKAPMNIANATIAPLLAELVSILTLIAPLVWLPPVWLGVVEEPELVWLELPDDEVCAERNLAQLRR